LGINQRHSNKNKEDIIDKALHYERDMN